jgi:hypothetical protein
MLSSASLFHFTRDFAALRKIVKEGFRPHYSREDLSMFRLPKCLGIPMISFCDIPLSRAEKHSKVYGCYALGLHKDWGKQKNISPVHYIYPGSICAEVIVKIYETLPHENILHQCDCLKFNPQTAIFFYPKPYDGELLKTGKDGKLLKPKEKVTFYDEREWRYVPFADKTIANAPTPPEVQPILSEGDYSSPETYEQKTKMLQEHYTLKFHASDIKFIIVGKEDEIPEMVKDIDDNLPCSENDKKKLITRIITMEQIRENF